MDELSFDQLVKRLSEKRTRRTSLRALAGGTLAAVVLAESPSTDARKRKKKCKAPKVKCGRKRCCAVGQACVDGACVTQCTPACGAGQECINGQCVCNTTICSTATNPNPGFPICFCGAGFSGESLCIASQSCSSPPPVDCGPEGSCLQGFSCMAFGCGVGPICVKTCI